MKKSAQCGQVTAAYSIKLTGAFGSPWVFSPSGPGLITSSSDCAKAGRTNAKPYGRTPKTAPASARAAVPAHNSRRVTRTGLSPLAVVIARSRVAATKQSRAERVALDCFVASTFALRALADSKPAVARAASEGGSLLAMTL